MITQLLCGRLLKTARARIARPALGLAAPQPAHSQRLETIVETFLGGFQSALGGKPLAAAEIDRELQGFWLEGAAMGVVLLDRLLPWRAPRWPALLSEAGPAQIYMLHVGAGWAMARLPGEVAKTLARHDPVLRWLLLDGYGFHEGFFHPERSMGGQPHPRRVWGYARRAFDQGLGRSMWFASGAEVRAIAAAIGNFAPERRGDLWSGVGLAATYAGWAEDADLALLRALAGPFLPQLAQGASFAAKARVRAGNLTGYQERACAALCGLGAAEAAALSDAALRDLPGDGAEPSFEVWRRRIQEVFSEKNEPVAA